MTHEAQPDRLMIAPTSSGKGVGMVIPTLLAWRGVVEIYDPKPSLPNWDQKFAVDPSKRNDWDRRKDDEGDDQ